MNICASICRHISPSTICRLRLCRRKMAYSTPFTQSFGSHTNMYGSLKSGSGMASMPYHMGSLGLGSLGMSSLDPMHPATMSYGAPCKLGKYFQS